MNDSIANILKEKIKGLPFIGKLGGLVQVMEDKKPINNRATAVRYPATCDYVDDGQCAEEAGRYLDMIPDSKKKSVIYFEDGGVTLLGREGKNYKFRSNLTLVGWLNKKELGYETCSISGLVIASIIQAIECRTFNGIEFGHKDLIRIDISPGSILPKNKNIFSKYTYDLYQQPLMHPFDYFAIQVNTEFHVNPQCVSEFINGVYDPCNNY